MPTEAKPLFSEEVIASVPPTFKEFFREVNGSFFTAESEKGISAVFSMVRDKLALLLQENRVRIKKAWRNRGDMGEFWNGTDIIAPEFLGALQLEKGFIRKGEAVGGTYFDGKGIYRESDDDSNFNFDQMTLFKDDGTEILPELTQGLPGIFNDVFGRIIARSNVIRVEKQRNVEGKRKKLEDANSDKAARAKQALIESDKEVLKTW